MMIKKKFLVIVPILLSGLFSFAAESNPADKIKMSAPAFVENSGQILDERGHYNGNVKFLFCQPGINIQLRDKGFSYDTYTLGEKKINYHRVDINFLNHNRNFTIEAQKEIQEEKQVYGVKTDGSALQIKSYEKVVYRNIYPKIDLEFFSDPARGMEYQFIVHPGGKINDILLEYKGADEIKLSGNQLKLKVSGGELSEKIPLSFILENGEIAEVYYVQKNKTTFGFSCDKINDPAKTLVVDPYPVLNWSTHFGDTGFDYVYDMAVDPVNGDIVIAGATSSSVNIATSGTHQFSAMNTNYNGFIAKFNSAGVLQWGTYYTGGCDFLINAVATTTAGEIVVTGQTCSNSGITTPGSHQPTYGGSLSDAFLAKFSSGGTRIWGTYYGGGGMDWGYDVALDQTNGDIYMVGATESPNAISTFGVHQPSVAIGGFYDGMIVKFNSAGQRLWGSYYGGNGDDYIYALTLVSGSPYFIGTTTSTNSMTTFGAFQSTYGGGNRDGFIGGITSSGSFRTFGTYYGGANDEFMEDMTNDGSSIYLVGSSNSPSGIASAGAYQTSITSGIVNAVIAKFSTGGSRVWATYYGTTGFTGSWGYGITKDASGNILVCGTSSSDGSIMTTAGAFQRHHYCSSDGFILKATSSGSRVWATYHGQSGGDSPTTIAENAGNIYIAGSTSSSVATLATPGAHQVSYGGGTCDGYIAKITETVSTNTVHVISGSAGICPNTSYTYSITPTIPGATSYQWNSTWGSGTTSANTFSFTTSAIISSGTISVYANCDPSIVYTMAVTAYSAPAIPAAISGNTLICNGSFNQYSVTTSTNITSYNWTLPSGWNGTSTTNSMSALAGPLSGTIGVSAMNSCGTSGIKTLSVTVSAPQLSLTPTNVTCFGACNGVITPSVSGGAPPYNYTPSTLTGLCAGAYTVFVTDNLGCPNGTSTFISQPPQLTYSASLINPPTCFGACNGSYVVTPVGGTPGYTASPASTSLCAGVHTFTITDANSCTTSGTVILNQPSPLTLNASSNPTAICSGNSGTLTANATGGTGTPTYSWTNLGSGSSIVVSPTISSVYTVTATDIYNCSTTLTINLSVNPKPNVQATGPGPVCAGTTSCFLGTGASTYTWTGPCGFSSISQSPCIPLFPNCSCTFYLTGTDANNCQNNDSVCVTVYPSPTVTPYTSDTLICVGQSATLTANGAINYSWNPGGFIASIVVSPTVTSTYTVTGYDANNCLASATITQSVSACTGIIGAEKISEEIKLYPNPNNGKFRMEIGIARENLFFEVYDARGQLIQREKFVNAICEIDLNKKANGIYFVRLVENNNLIWKGKFIIQ